jgi:cysteine-rich repeat protein
MPQGPRCGDGVLDDREACDDGNDSSADSCLNGCSFATCGDGFVWQGAEECDPGKFDTGCTKGCLLCGSTPESYFRGGNAHCYTMHGAATSEQLARSVCQREGGDLWTLTSEAESLDVADKLTLAGQLWLGLQTTSTGHSWVSGENTKYTRFAVGEPSDTALGCVAFDAANSGTWSSEACDAKLGFVCERTPAFVFPDQHHAYRLHTGVLDADAARARCRADGGQLVALESNTERLFVGKNLGIAVWVDATDRAVENQYVWRSGQPVDSAAFAAGRPSDTDGTQGCLLLNAGDKFADSACSESHAFVCEFE